MKKVVLITGAGIGIGAACAGEFAEAGYHVVVTDVLAREGEETAERIRDSGQSAEFAPLDVSDTAQTDSLIQRVWRDHGRLDTVIANAGIAHRVPIGELTDALWQHTIEIDLGGVLRAFRAAVPVMRQQGRGSLIGLSSIMGTHYGWGEHAHYSAAKSGVVGLVRALAVELASEGIRVNGISPGYVRTAQSLSEVHSLGEAGLEQAAGYIPIGRVGAPSEIASVALFLASEASRYMTGQVLTVDGGLVVGRY